MNHLCVFECGHTYHMACLEEKSMLWKQSSLEDTTAITFGCFLCDHTSRRFARPDPTLPNALPPKGLTEQQLDFARVTIIPNQP